jgi:hypothetical protein
VGDRRLGGIVRATVELWLLRLRDDRRAQVAVLAAVVALAAGALLMTRSGEGEELPRALAETVTQAEPQQYAHVVDGVVVAVVVTTDAEIADNPTRFPGLWVETFPDGSRRGVFAAVGFSYNATTDRFYPPAPAPSWTLDDEQRWQPPVPKPDDGRRYTWDEASQVWVSQESD